MAPSGTTNVFDDAISNKHTFETISNILSTTRSSNSSTATFDPSPANPSALLPNLFSTAIKKRHAAQQASFSQALQQMDAAENDRSPPLNGTSSDTQLHADVALSPLLAHDALRALHQLRQHYNHLLDNSTRVRGALEGYSADNVVWLPPSAHKDFEIFLNTLWARWARPSVPPDGLPALLQWAANPNIHPDVLMADVDSSASAYQSLEKAFHTFRLALEDIVNMHSMSKPTSPTITSV